MPATTEGALASPPFASAGLIEYLECDTRPTFIIDADFLPSNIALSSPVVFSNAALRKQDSLLNSIQTLIDSSSIGSGKSQDLVADTTKFLSWLQLSTAQGSIWFNGLLWSSTCFQQRWLIVSGCPQPIPDLGNGYDGELTPSHNGSLESGLSMRKTKTNSRKTSSRGRSDFQAISIPESPSGHSESLARAFGVDPTAHNLMVLGFDWAKTTLGPIRTWCQVLRQMIPYLLNGLQPGAILWGPERIMIYNEGYIALIKALHPVALGCSAQVLFADFWHDTMESRWHSVELYGAARYENALFYLDRSGFLEEVYFTYSLTPLRDNAAQCLGVDSRCFETTRQVVAEARMLSLLNISKSAASATSLNEFWQGLVSAMASNTLDFPLFALYSVQDPDLGSNETDGDSSTTVSRERWFLRGSSGYPQGHCAIPGMLEADSDASFAPAFNAVLGSASPCIFSEGDSVLHADLLDGCVTPGLRLKCRQIVVCPLHFSSRNAMGFLALGVNPSRPYDDEYKTFVQLLSRQIETSISPILSLLNEKLQAQINAQKSEYEQKLLTTELERQTLEAQQSELRFLRFAEQAPLGVYILNADDGVRFANKAWFKLTGIDPAYGGTHGWLLHVHPDDRVRVDEEWKRLKEGYVQIDFEWRALKIIPNKEDEVIYLRASCFPELSADGKMKSVTGVLMDLSLERAQQNAGDERLKDALEAKQAQEYFMDMVSHEIRNPLHAILQLAEETSSTLEEMKPGSPLTKHSLNVRDCIENIHTIMYCGHHQKQILDDVLTLSKLNSDMLTLSLTDVAPISVVRKALKFFDSDIRLSNIDITLNLTGIVPGSQYPNVLMDSGRVLQILVNLVGNSIKFMKDRSIRKLTLTVNMESSKPAGGHLRYLPSGKKYVDPTIEGFSGRDQAVYVHYSVEDTGPGLSPQEMDVLFERFKQVSPKTHTQYGGSGLGLFISRELAERHGGEIGLASIVDQGSTFGFYVKCLIAERQITGSESSSGTTAMMSKTNGTTTSRNSSPSIDSPKTTKREQLSSRNSITILIVEDNITNQNILNRQLKKLGYQTQTANHGEEALSILKESTWWHQSIVDSPNLSIILCDLEMPVMDGMTCVREIRDWQQKQFLSQDIPVVALTGNARNEQIKAAKDAGFDDVMSKPYTIQSLVSMIESMISKE